MDGWPTSRLERDIARVGILVVAVGSAVGAAVGWLIGHALHQLHDPGISDHFPERDR